MSYIFVKSYSDLVEDTKATFKEQLVSSKSVNGSSVSAHIQAAVKQDIAGGMTEAEANKKWKVKPKSKQLIHPEIAYIINLYYQFFNVRNYGMNGINPLNLHDIECYERRYGMISEPVLQILFELDDIYYANKD